MSNRIATVLFTVGMESSEWDGQWHDDTIEGIDIVQLEDAIMADVERDPLWCEFIDGDYNGAAAQALARQLDAQKKQGKQSLRADVVVVSEWEWTDGYTSEYYGYEEGGFSLKSSRVMTRAEFDNAIKAVLP